SPSPACGRPPEQPRRAGLDPPLFRRHQDQELSRRDGASHLSLLVQRNLAQRNTPRLRARCCAPGPRSRRDFPRRHPASAENAAHPYAAPPVSSTGQALRGLVRRPRRSGGAPDVKSLKSRATATATATSPVGRVLTRQLSRRSLVGRVLTRRSFADIKIKGFRAVTARATFLCLCKETWRKESTPRLRARCCAPGPRSRRDFPS